MFLKSFHNGKSFIHLNSFKYIVYEQVTKASKFVSLNKHNFVLCLGAVSDIHPKTCVQVACSSLSSTNFLKRVVQVFTDLSERLTYLCSNISLTC